MKQKVVIRVVMCDHKKSRTKALKIAATAYGVESVALKGHDRDEIEVIGDGIDTVGLTKLLRKNVGRADLLSVGPAKEEKEKNKNENKYAATMMPPVWSFPYPYNYGYAAPYHVHEVRDPSCSIM